MLYMCSVAVAALQLSFSRQNSQLDIHKDREYGNTVSHGHVRMTQHATEKLLISSVWVSWLVRCIVVIVVVVVFVEVLLVVVVAVVVS